MSERDDEQFRLRPRPPRSGRGSAGKPFLSRVIAQVSRTGAVRGFQSGPRNCGAKLGRGHVAARLPAFHPNASTRRVVIKARFVVLKKSGVRSVETHLRYIVRDGVTRDGQPAQPYGPQTEGVDLEAFEARGRDDRHQFRFIVAPEDADQLGDLRGFTRGLTQQMERDLGTRLDWLAVDHWDTDNPHTHVVLRGRDETGHDLVIARDYMAYGMRGRAAELATEWLGPRTELEIRVGLQREVEQERLTSLDRSLLARSHDDIVDLRADNGTDRRRTLLIGRLQRLSTMGLAEESGPGRWRLRPEAERTLRVLGERNDIIRTMQRALAGDQRALAFFDPRTTSHPIIGRIAAKGLADELQDQPYAVIDGVDGCMHYAKLPRGTELSELPTGGILEVRPITERSVDRTIASMARNGLYETEHHLTALRRAPNPCPNAQEIVATHVRRLEALRRAGIVERLRDGVWRVPTDLPARGRAYDLRRLDGCVAVIHSSLPVEKQICAIGATWLDTQLGSITRAGAQGFGLRVREAMVQRQDFLVSQGLAQRSGQRIVLASNLLATLRIRELTHTAAAIAAETGLSYRGIHDGPVAGVYRRSLALVSGRFAMLDDGLGFCLVPWGPVIEKRLGQALNAVVTGDRIHWTVTRQLGRSIGG